MPRKPKQKNNIFEIGLVLLIIATAIFYLFSSNKSSTISYSWIAFGPENTQVVRHITSKNDCPQIQFGWDKEKMDLRAYDELTGPVRVCEKAIPNNTSSVILEGKTLPLLLKEPRKILVLGDTGCRIKGKEAQACDDQKYWPFAQIAKAGAQFNPDLIIHVGDYIYRQEECPAGDTGCQGTAFGNNFRTFNEDFFKPAAPLLEKAPWLFIRGNHETCPRFGDLWFRFLDIHPFQESCQEYTQPYLVTFNNLQLLVVDSASADDFIPVESKVNQYISEFGNLKGVKENLWFVTHRPLYGVKVVEEKKLKEEDQKADAKIAKEEPEDEEHREELPEDTSAVLVQYTDGDAPKQKLVLFNRTLQAAVEPTILDAIEFSLSGHFHNFEMLSFNGNLPPQVIAGNTATELEPAITDVLNGLAINGEEVSSSKFSHEFGYMTMEQLPDNTWTMSQYAPQGNLMFTCLLKDRNIECKNP